MKFLYPNLLLAIISLIPFVSCSDELIDADKENSEQLPSSSSPSSNDGKCYLSFNVGESYGTRMNEEESDTETDNDFFIDGQNVQDYAVHDALLLLFSLPKNNSPLTIDRENQAKLVSKLVMTKGDEEMLDKVDITKTVALQTEIDRDLIDTQNFDYYGLMIVNDPGWSEKAKMGMTFRDWKYTIVDKMWVVYDGLTYLAMTNAPKWVSGGEPITLQKIDMTKLGYEKENLQPAATFYVQRGAVSVRSIVINVGGEGNFRSFYIIQNDAMKADFLMMYLNWNLSNVNSVSYPVQIPEGLSNDFGNIWSTGRFYESGAGNFNRIYWGKDPNYYADDDTYQLYKLSTDKFNEDLAGTIAIGSVGYLMENTMEVDAMLTKYSTLTIYKTAYFPGSAIQGWTEEKTQDVVRNLSDNKNFNYEQNDYRVSFIKNANTGKIIVNDETYGRDFNDRFKEAYKEVTGEVPVFSDDILDSFPGGYYSLSDLFDEVLTVNLTDDSKQQIADLMETTGWDDPDFGYHAKGITYYSVPIRHFSDQEGVAWGIGDPTYNNDNAKFLGRYGLVRNTQYIINVKSVLGPGEPIVPEPNDDPDDSPYNFMIDFDIQIKAWGKRNNSFDL